MNGAHTCNAWCFGGLHALLFDTEIADQPVLEQVSRTLAAQSGFALVGLNEVRPEGFPAPGTPTKEGVARGRMVIWVR